MKLHELEFSNPKSPRRVGRGIASGQGKTAGRGTKGQKARTGGNIPSYFEGGQNPLMQRLPKQKGFHSRRPTGQIIHLSQLNQFKAGQTITAKELKTAGLINNTKLPVKLLGNGKIERALTLEVQAASQSAKAAFAKIKGKLVIKPIKSTSKKPTPKKPE